MPKEKEVSKRDLKSKEQQSSAEASASSDVQSHQHSHGLRSKAQKKIVKRDSRIPFPEAVLSKNIDLPRSEIGLKHGQKRTKPTQSLVGTPRSDSRKPLGGATCNTTSMLIKIATY